MIRTTRKNKKGEIEVIYEGELEEFEALDEWDEAWENNRKYCDEDGIPYDMLDENGDFIE
jgi:hypothetical protein